MRRTLLLLGGAALTLSACTTTQTGKVESTLATVCQSVPLAQIAYNVALQNHDNATANAILDTIRLSCPAVLSLIHTYQQAPNAAVVTPERG